MSSLQSGRSMIEMLGVLAIIGVLSVAGIAGYSKAMYKYRMNQTIDIVTEVVMNLYEITNKPLGTAGNEIDTAQEMIDYGIFPDCQPVDDVWGDENRDCKLPVGQLWIDYSLSSVDQEFQHGRGEIMVTFTGPNRTQECIDFASARWESIVPADMWPPYGFMKAGSNRVYSHEDSKFTYTQAEIAEGCKTACEADDYCSVYMAFHSAV